MKRKLVEIYGLSVCFVAMGFIVFYVSLAAWNAVEIVNPAFSVDDATYSRHLDDESFSDFLMSTRGGAGSHFQVFTSNKPVPDTTEPQVFVSPAGDQLTAQRLASWDKRLNIERRSGKKRFVDHLMFLVILSLVFFTHWKLAAKFSGSR